MSDITEVVERLKSKVSCQPVINDGATVVRVSDIRILLEELDKKDNERTHSKDFNDPVE